MGNHALDINGFVVNGKSVDIHITTRGSDWIFTVTSIMGTLFVCILGASFLKSVKNRFFFYTLAAPTFVAFVVNFSIASNLGWTPIDVEWHRSNDDVAGNNRQIWYVRYIGWFLVWPIISLAILLTSMVPTLYILWTVFLTASMAILATVGALVRTDYKWAFYAFWLFAWLLVGYNLIWLPRKYASSLGLDIARIHNISSGFIWCVWGLYPICWGVSEGGNVIPPDSELIYYGILDCLLLPVLFSYFLWAHWNIDPARLGLALRSYEDPLPGTLPHHEKQPVLAPAEGVTNGTAPAEPTPAAAV
ncbi:hypothetical protein RBB50_005932 [Rhinocladiella similis]